MDIEPGTIVDRYTIDGRLGEGGMAVVYKARHNQLGTMHAIKVLTIPGKSIRQRLLQEGRVQALLRHPNIVTVTDVIDVEGQPGLVMEMIDGMSLETMIEKVPLNVDQVDALARGIIDGVGEAHRQGLIHRDLKPGNVMVQFTSRGPVPKVTDFGLAKVLAADEFSGTKTRSGMAMGTPCYMAPEQIRDAKSVDRRADIWALGCMLYEMLTQRRAFDGPDMFAIFTAVTSGEYVKVRALLPDLPERMVRAIEGCLVVDRERRYADCDALLADWTGKAAEPANAAGSAGALWGSDLLKSPSTSQTPSKVAGTWSGEGEVTGSLHAVPSPMAVDSLVPENDGDMAIGTKPTRPRTAPTGIVAAPVSAVHDPAPPASTSKAPYVAAGVGVLALLLVAGLGLVGLGVAGNLLAAPSAEAPAATQVTQVTTAAPLVHEPDAPAPDAPTPEDPPAAPTSVAPDPIVSVVTPIKSVPKVPQTPKPPPEKIVVTVATPDVPKVTAKGLLIVNSRPWSNITLDGVAAQRTGGWKREVSAGKHVLELQTADGLTAHQTVDVRATGETVFCWDFNLSAPCPK